ncbi:CLUMA_CG002314, isoform A [Clunio marinus]|uniref:CLUMA_CG002314, isoform A n=1 Tax=Clunio marinus TaxID=568069 RepID=A0A1J1HKD1_9DIPT|nr:CLUMA_CG002314, isoform A [Clunio marinus]
MAGTVLCDLKCTKVFLKTQLDEELSQAEQLRYNTNISVAILQKKKRSKNSVNKLIPSQLTLTEARLHILWQFNYTKMVVEILSLHSWMKNNIHIIEN